MNPPTATSKLAQTARGTRRCEGCGRTKGLDTFGIHPRWGTPMKICMACMTERRRAGGAKRSKTVADKRAKAIKIEAREQVKDVKQSVRIEVAWAKLEGFAVALNHDGLTKLVADVRKVVSHG